MFKESRKQLSGETMGIPNDETSPTKAPRNYMISIKIINDFKGFSQKRRWTSVVKTLHRDRRSQNSRSFAVDIRRTGSRKLFLDWKQRIHLCNNRVEIKFPPKKFHSLQSTNKKREKKKRRRKEKVGWEILIFHWESNKNEIQLLKYQMGRR